MDIPTKRNQDDIAKEQAVASTAQKLWGPGARVGIIGGLGEMGRLFARFFKHFGYQVEVADLNTLRSNREVMEAVDIVVFSVPLHNTVAVIRELAPYARSHQLLMDLSSPKVGPVTEMLTSTAAVVGLHPMFGGRVSSFAGQTIVACPVRIEPREWQGLRQLFTKAGMQVKECSPDEHDRMMSVIQVLFHLTSMLVGRVLRELKVNIDETLEYTSPSYRIEMSLLGRMFAQNGGLYSAITQMNPNTGEILALLRQGLDSYTHWYQGQDFNAFVADFAKSAEHLGRYCERAYQESSEVLDFGVRLAEQANSKMTSA